MPVYRLQVLNLRNNQLAEIPKEIEDCKFLRIVLLGKNLLSTLPGQFFLLGDYHTQSYCYRSYNIEYLHCREIK